MKIEIEFRDPFKAFAHMRALNAYFDSMSLSGSILTIEPSEDEVKDVLTTFVLDMDLEE